MRVRRAAIASAAAALLAAGVMQAAVGSATPYAGEYRTLEVAFAAHAADHAVYQVSLVATAAGTVESRREQALYVDMKRCVDRHGCRTVLHSRQPLSDTQITVAPDLSSATLRASVGGVSIVVQASHEYVTTGPVSVSHPGAGLFPLGLTKGKPELATDVYWSADHLTLRFGGKSCVSGTAYLASYQVVDPTGDDVRDPRTATKPAPLTLRKPGPRAC